VGQTPAYYQNQWIHLYNGTVIPPGLFRQETTHTGTFLMTTRIVTLLIFILAGFACVTAGVTGKDVTYSADTTKLKGYLAWNDSAEGKHPAVIVVPEWWGNNDYSKKRAEMLAELGYVALAVDMYGDGKQADNPTEAGALAGSVMGNPDVMKARFTAALDLLKNNPHVDPERIGAIGYCFGGGVVLGMARLGTDLKSVVSFHGSLATKNPAEKGKVSSKILVCHGAADKFVSMADVAKFKEEMKTAGVKYKFVAYPGATHAFTNPAATDIGKKFNMPIAYNAAADTASWKEMKKWFRATLEK
jgi:dienelactone hydrolase